MQRYLVTMTLESDACFGAGESKNGLVNTEVLIDDNGFPYFLGKTFKGVLRESIKNILEPTLTLDEKILLKQILGSTEGLKQNEKEPKILVKWSNFKIDGAIREAFKNLNLKKHWKMKYEDETENKHIKINKLEKIDTASKQNAFMKIEQSTRINELQVAEKSSLRSIRVIKKGLIFTSVVDLSDELNSEENLEKACKLLERCLKTVKHIGTGKTRGLGRVKLELSKAIICGMKDDFKMNIDEENNVILYEFETKEPVKVSKNEEQYDFEPTHKYIPGNTMRGAFFAQWISKITNKENQNDKVIELIKGIKFYNSYPMYVECPLESGDEDSTITDGKDVLVKKYYSIPTPNIYRNDKQKFKEYKVSDKTELKLTPWIHKDSSVEDSYKYETLFDSLDDQYFIKKQNYINKFQPGEFCYVAKDDLKEDALFCFDIKKKEYFHHTHNKKNENIYRYEAIKPGYRYYGLLDLRKLGNQDLKEQILNQLKEVQNFWIGGSKKTGYGRVLMQSIKGFENTDEAFEYMGITTKETTKDMTYLYSDYIGDFKKSIENTKDSIEADMSLELGMTTGYNNYWNARTPIREMIKKGSVIKGNFGTKLLENAEMQEEGFGIVLENLRLFNTQKIYMHRSQDDFIANQNYYRSQKKSNLDYSSFFKLYLEEFIDRKIKSWLAQCIDNGSFEKFVLQIKNKFQNTFKTNANELIQILDDKKSYAINGNNIQEWVDLKNKVSMNREQTKKNYKFLGLQIFDNFILEEVLDEKFKFESNPNTHKNKTQLHIDFDKKYKDLYDECNLIDLKLGLNNSIIITKNKISNILLRHILYYAVQSYDNSNGGK